MSNTPAVVSGVNVALTIIRDLQKAVNRAKEVQGKPLDVEGVKKILERNLDAELDWDASKQKRLAELEKKAVVPGPKTRVAELAVANPTAAKAESKTE